MALVEECGLSSAGIAGHPKRFVVALDGPELVACSGAELTKDAALIRSVAVRSRFRGTGLGRRMVREIIDRITFRGIRKIYLLTETAAPFFEKRGFHEIDRSEIPRPFLNSSELQGCSESSTCMRLIVS